MPLPRRCATRHQTDQADDLHLTGHLFRKRLKVSQTPADDQTLDRPDLSPKGFNRHSSVMVVASSGKVNQTILILHVGKQEEGV